MTIVVDSGIWISAFQFGGTPQAALDAIYSQHTIAICKQIAVEIRATLIRKFSWQDTEVFSVLEEYTGEAVWVEVDGSVHGVCRDPKDDMILECAVKANAEMILSGDLDLLSLRSYNGISILTAREYLVSLTSEE